MAANKSTVYLDFNATTPLLPEAAEAIQRGLSDFGNPSSVHSFGRRARAAVEGAREAVAAMTNAKPGNVVFTSGGTEANTLALRGVSAATVLASAVEHASVLSHITDANQIPVDGQGVADLSILENRLKAARAPVLVALMYANNETGVLQPIHKAVAVARRHGALVYCDAVQAAGKAPIDFAALGVDMLGLSAHKFGGPKGIGALIVRDELMLEPLLSGGGQERRRRAGTENVLGIMGFGAAAANVTRLLKDAGRIKELRESLENKVQRENPRARIYGAEVPRLCNTSCIGLAGVSAETQVMKLDLSGISVSAGSACSSGKIAPSHVLTAMGASPADAKSAIRVSLGWTTTAEDVDRFFDTWRLLALQVAA